MNLEDLAFLIDKSDIDRLRVEIDSNNSSLFETFKNGNSLFHYLVKSSIEEAVKIKFIFMLSDAGLDINLQNYREQTCLHLAVILGQVEIVNCLLQNGADLTIIDQADFCAYNHARRLEDKELSRKIVKIMQAYFPTYWIGIDNKDINIIRRLVNSWCKFKVKRNNKYLLDYAREKNFKPAVDLFNQLETQMDLCFAVLACNTNKVEHIIKNNYSNLLLNFKNMKEKGGSIMLYAIKQKNYNLLKILLQLKPNILNEYIVDEIDIDYPIYFAALKNYINEDCLKLITPEINVSNREQNVSNIFYKGMSLLRYAIDVDYDTQILYKILDEKYCFRELITVRDPEFLTCKEYASKCGNKNYENLIDSLTVDYITKSKFLRMQLALNGFDFFNEDILIDDQDLLSWAKKKEDKELLVFLENVKTYQKQIRNFHRAVEKNDYYNVKALQKADIKLKEFKTDDIFFENLLESRCKGESQTVFHKAVLNGYYEILSLLLDSYIEIDINKRLYSKLDQIRDHCFRTPYHYAMGVENNNRIIQLLSQFGFSTNVFDKDGMGPLDFQERSCSKELKYLLEMHKFQEYANKEEPNPWSWSVWTRIRREKDAFKQLISVSHPCLNQIESKHQHAAVHGHTCDHLHSHNKNHHEPETKLPTSLSVQNVAKSTNDLSSNNYYSNCVLL